MTSSFDGTAALPPKAPFRPYSSADREACLANFDANCPAFFAPDERAEAYEGIVFLDFTLLN